MLYAITQPIYLFAVTMVNISTALFLMRITPSRHYRRFLWSLITILVSSTTIIFVATLLQCKPLNVVHEKDFEKGQCFPPATLRSLSYVNSSVLFFVDVILAILPIPILWHVQIGRKVKVKIILILSLSIL